MPQSFKISLLSLLLVFLSACDTYDFSVNDKLVYTPKALFTDFEATDPALQKCLEQAVIDGKVSSARELRTLSCSHAGVTTLLGLEVFTGLSRLKLSSNALRDIAPLAALTSLEVLLLDSNQIIDTTPLLELPALTEVNLQDNSELFCPANESLLTVETITLPAHCT
ncbi:MAG: hypothetical protein V7746_22035 [Halioglobus sp.]